MRKYQFWTTSEIQFLKDNYKNMTQQELADSIGKSKQSVVCQMNKLQLIKTKRRSKWNGCVDTPENCKRCDELYGYKECYKPVHLCSEENRGYDVNRKG